MRAFYNEIEPYPAEWLRNLIVAGHIAHGVVDERSIVDLSPDDRDLGDQPCAPGATGRMGRPLAGGSWNDITWLDCTDGKQRPTQPGIEPLAHGAPARVGRLRAYGNGLCAPQAAAFIRAVMECL